MDSIKYRKVSLCRLNGISCFGCCGHHFKSINEIKETIHKNNISFKHKKTLKEFMNKNKDLNDSGVCKSLVTLRDNSIGCPGHPKQCRKELRDCNILYECKVSFFFNNEWDKIKQKKFLDIISKMDSFEYSLFMSDEKKVMDLMI